MNLLEYDNDAAADKIARYKKEKESHKEYLYKSKHGPKRYKEFMKKDAEAAAKGIPKTPKGLKLSTKVSGVIWRTGSLLLIDAI